MATSADLLAKLQNAMPVQNQRIADQQKAARAIQLQQAVSAAPTGGVPQQQAQAQVLGAGVQQMAGEQAVTQAVGQQKQLEQLGQAALGVEKTQQQQQIGQQQLAFGQQQIESQATVATTNRDVEDKILNDQLTFKQDDLGRIEYQENQLLDYAIVSTKNEQELKGKLQNIEFASKQENIILSSIYDAAKDSKLAGWKMGEQRLDQRASERLTEAMAILEKKLALRKKKGANRGAFGAAGGVIGGIIGMKYGGTPGAIAGSAGGVAAGEAASEYA